MTCQQILWKINTAAEIAAQSSLDAHGDFVSAQDAWEFMLEAFCDDWSVMGGLPEAMPRQFKHDYARHCRILTANKVA